MAFLDQLTGLTAAIIVLPALIIGWAIGADGGAHNKGLVRCCLRAFVWSCILCGGLLVVVQLFGFWFSVFPQSRDDWMQALYLLRIPVILNLFPSLGTALIAYNLAARREAREALEKMQQDAQAAARAELERRDEVR